MRQRTRIGMVRGQSVQPTVMFHERVEPIPGRPPATPLCCGLVAMGGLVTVHAAILPRTGCAESPPSSNTGNRVCIVGY